MALRSAVCISEVIKFGHVKSVGHRCFLKRTIHCAMKGAGSAMFEQSLDHLANRQKFVTVKKYSTDVVNVEKFTPLFLNMMNCLDNTVVANSYGSLTYRDLLYNSCDLACDLVQMCGIFNKPLQLNGARVAMFCEDNTSLLVSLYGCWLANGISVPVGHYHMDEVLKHIKDLDCSAILTTEQHIDSLMPLAKDLSIPIKLLDMNQINQKCNTKLDFWEILDSRQFGPTIDAYKTNIDTNFYVNNTAVILFDTYSIAKKKYLGTVLTFGNLQVRLDTMADVGKWRSSDVSMCTLQSSHVELFIVSLLLPLYCGASCVLLEEFKPQVVLGLIMDRKVNRLLFTHLEYLQLINFISDSKEKIHLNPEHLHVLNIGRSYLNHNTAVQWNEVIGGNLPFVYSKVECGNVMISTADVNVPKPNYLSIGKLLPGLKGRIAIETELENDVLCEFDHNSVTEVDKPQPYLDGFEIHIGSLQLKGAGIFTRYWNDENETAKLFTEDGWFKTGDSAQLKRKNDDYILLITKIKEMPTHKTDWLPRLLALFLCVLTALKRKLGMDVLEQFVLDFERAAWLAIQEVFPTVAVKGCLFHWTQAVWRHVQQLGLVPTYRQCQQTHGFILVTPPRGANWKHFI